MTALVEARGLAREFPGPDAPVRALRGVDLELSEGELVLVRGPSGAGKSTLLALLAGLDTPTAGGVRFRCEDLSSAGPERRAELRRLHMGFVFQDFRLVRHLSARDNARLPGLLLGGSAGREAAARADRLLARVGLDGRAHRRPESLSRGEQQRVSLARALAHRPALILADEPTASLDPASRDAVWELLLELQREEGVAILAAAHDAAPARGRILRLEDGRLLDARAEVP